MNGGEFDADLLHQAVAAVPEAAHSEVVVIAAPVLNESIRVYRRGHPLPVDLRSRIMLRVQQQMSATDIAKQLQISTRTVWRYKNAAIRQQVSVPQVRSRGGYRSSIAMLDRNQMLQLAELLLNMPKLTIRELKQMAVEKLILDPQKVPSDTTIWRAIKKMDIDWKKASYTDPKGIRRPFTHPVVSGQQTPSHGDHVNASSTAPAAVLEPGANAIMEERAAFRFVQRLGTEGQLNPYNLMFMDESNLRLFDQQHHVWSQAHRRGMLLRPKGMSPTFNVIATIGVENDTPGGMFIHYVVIPPRRDFRGVPKTFKPYEFRNPKAAIDLGYSTGQIQNDLTAEQLQQLMKEQRIRLPSGMADAETFEKELRKILNQVRTKGKVGLPRDLPIRQSYLGGSIKAFRSTAVDIVDYVEQLLVPWYVKRKLQGLVTECNEDSDGIQGCPDSGHHFSIPYVEPKQAARIKLLQTKQTKQRQSQRADHHLTVYRRSKRGQAQAGEQLLHQLTQQVRTKQAEFNDAADALTRYDRQMLRSGSYVPFQNEIAGAGYKTKLAKKYLIWDGASTHGAIRVTSARKKSFWHSHATKVGMAGVVYLPPRTPTLNPIELLFGFIKHHIRKNCPDEGYTPAGLLQAIHNAFKLVRPEMIRNWVKKAGYRFSEAAANLESDNTNQQDNLPEEVDPFSRVPAAAASAAAEALRQNSDGEASMEIDGEERKSEAVEREEKTDADQAAMKPAAIPSQGNELPIPDATPENVCYSAQGKKFGRKSSFICMDENGTVKRRKRRGHTEFAAKYDQSLDPQWGSSVHMRNVASDVQKMRSFDVMPQIRPLTEEQAFATVAHSRRWAGLGPQPRELAEQMPQSVVRNQEHGGELWEIEGIVEHRGRGRGAIEYLVRYKGYTEADDEWLPENALETAVGAIKEYWARIKI